MVTADLSRAPTSRAALEDGAHDPGIVLDATAVSHRFDATPVLHDVSLRVPAGTIHAVLGPNGAGKTTLVRILAGLLQPTTGSIRVDGLEFESSTRRYRERIGYIPSGDRSFYLRISGLENLLFFGRLHGLTRRESRRRALALLEEVGLADAARRRVGNYSHGMQKRLSIARVLMTTPPVMLVDEATHDLDPEGARRVRELIAERVAGRACVVWVTQRLEEIRGFADTVTLLGGGRVRFAGTVPELMAHAEPRRFVLHLHAGGRVPPLDVANRVLEGEGRLMPVSDDSAHFVLDLARDAVLGTALARLTASGIAIVSCHEEQSEIEEAFVLLTQEAQ